MARYHRRTETTIYPLTVSTHAPSLGRLLAQAGPDWKRIGLDVLIRAVLVALATFIFWRRGDLTTSSPFVLITTACIYAVLVLFPLRHCRDSMGFYENGIVYRGKSYLFQTPKAEWMSPIANSSPNPKAMSKGLSVLTLAETSTNTKFHS